ncbi:uncharacterized protein EI90DRAFT_145949 [Cantharellus anzutake]|uniref:uncharacterized protein n=1 Tax=Cantharellus anzutake TaxID=1750568 RepID=UPI0019067B7C|nr:uncharacterized protein EI90DRAFT_145949 [Cantharellus anzutake]KAF8317544.1 hypothetical protein EI90DRAFT_145949 [Cantharellus anzutake]
MDGVSFILMPASATTATASPPVTAAAVAAAANPTAPASAAAAAAAAHLSWRPTPRDSPLLSLSTYDSIHSRASSPSFRPSPKLRTATPPVLPMLLPFHSPSSSSPSRSQPQTPASFHYPHHQYYTTSHPSTPSSATCPDYHPATPSKLASSSLLLTSISPSPPPLPPPSSTDTHSYIHNYATPNTPASNPTSTTNSPRFNHSSPRSSIFQYPASVPMTPSSSMGLPSPTFPPRKLSSLQPPAPPPPSASASGGGSVPMTPTHLSHVHSPRTLSPIVPPRSPARMPSVVAVSGEGENVVIPFIESVLQEGDVLGEGCELNGEVIRCVSVSGCVGDGSGSRNGSGGMTSPPRGAKFEVVRKLGTGSYAVVFLVREVVSGLKEETTTTPTPTYGGEDVFLFDENECKRGESGRKYGREFAIKCLSRANLSSADLEVQMPRFITRLDLIRTL